MGSGVFNKTLIACGLFAFAMLALGARTASASSVCSIDNVDAYLSAQGKRHTTVNKAVFYDFVAESLPIFDEIGDHFEGTNAILDRWNSDDRLTDNRWLAYMLATSYHETAARMFPVREHLAASDEAAVKVFERNSYYRDKEYWKADPETGEHYFGRGYVQLTWAYNYKRADKWFDITDQSETFLLNPERALDVEEAVRVTFDGMIYGWFTGHCLLRHFAPNQRADWSDARRIINGLDRAADIAAQAQVFLAAIEKAERGRGKARMATVSSGARMGAEYVQSTGSDEKPWYTSLLQNVDWDSFVSVLAFICQLIVVILGVLLFVLGVIFSAIADALLWIGNWLMEFSQAENSSNPD